jgi:four helix bundle protein
VLSHEKLQVYQRTIDFLTSVYEVIRDIAPGNSDIVNQLKRASLSIALNIAEGAGKTGPSDKKRFYSIARGSALECAAIFDVLLTWNLVRTDIVKTIKPQLHEIIAMLSALSLKEIK